MAESVAEMIRQAVIFGVAADARRVADLGLMVATSVDRAVSRVGRRDVDADDLELTINEVING